MFCLLIFCHRSTRVQILRFRQISLQDTASSGRSVARCAVNQYRFICGNFSYSAGQVLQRNVDRIFKDSFVLYFGLSPHINDGIPAFLGIEILWFTLRKLFAIGCIIHECPFDIGLRSRFSGFRDQPAQCAFILGNQGKRRRRTNHTAHIIVFIFDYTPTGSNLASVIYQSSLINETPCLGRLILMESWFSFTVSFWSLPIVSS